MKTRFEQSAAVIGPSQRGPLMFPSGFTVHTVRKGVVDARVFVPIVMAGGGARPHDPYFAN